MILQAGLWSWTHTGCALLYVALHGLGPTALVRVCVDHIVLAVRAYAA